MMMAPVTIKIMATAFVKKANLRIKNVKIFGAKKLNKVEQIKIAIGWVALRADTKATGPAPIASINKQIPT